MEADRLSALRNNLDEYLLRCADRVGPNPRAMQPLALELISHYHDEIAQQCGGMPEQVARHLRNAGMAAQNHEPPVVARELDAALAVIERMTTEGEGATLQQTAKPRSKLAEIKITNHQVADGEDVQTTKEKAP